jgi:hypothetical protein
MIVTKANQSFLFIHIPRTGGTSVYRAISGEASPNYGMSISTIKQWGLQESLNQGHRPLYQIDSPPSTPIVTCVRNPYDRVYSAYLTGQKQYPILVQKPFPQFVVEDLPDVVRRQVNHGNRREPLDLTGIHFTPMYIFLTNKSGRVQFDYVLYQERLLDDTRRVLGYFQIPSLSNLPFDQGSESQPPTPLSYLKYYDRKSLDIIYSLYRTDFEVFHYPIHTISDKH